MLDVVGVVVSASLNKFCCRLGEVIKVGLHDAAAYDVVLHKPAIIISVIEYTIAQ